MSVIVLSTVKLPAGMERLEGVINTFIRIAAGEYGLHQENAGRASLRENCVNINLESGEDAPGIPTGDTLSFSRDGVLAEFYIDAAGALAVRVSGRETEERLREIGQELAGRVAQQYAYHRLVTELKARHMNVVDETVEEDGTVRMRVRVYQG